MDLNYWSKQNLASIADELGVDKKGNKIQIIKNIQKSGIDEENILKIAQQYPILKSVKGTKAKKGTKKTKTQKVSKKKTNAKKGKKSTIKTSQKGLATQNQYQLSEDTSKIISNIYTLLENYNNRLTKIEEYIGIYKNPDTIQNINMQNLEKTKISSKNSSLKNNSSQIFSSETSKTTNPAITDEEIFQLISKYYYSSNEKVGINVPIPIIIENIQSEIDLSAVDIGDIMYRLFHRGRLELQPGKARIGEPLTINGHQFYWLSMPEEN